jgi:hypothetical protein
MRAVNIIAGHAKTPHQFFVFHKGIDLNRRQEDSGELNRKLSETGGFDGGYSPFSSQV